MDNENASDRLANQNKQGQKSHKQTRVRSKKHNQSQKNTKRFQLTQQTTQSSAKMLNPSSKGKQNSIFKQESWEKKQNSSQKKSDNEIIKKNETGGHFNFGFKRLEGLCDKDPSEIVFVITNKINGFMDLFKQNKEPDWIFLLMKVSAKICSTEFIQSKMVLFSELTCHAFIKHLKLYILSTPTEKNLYRCDNMNVFFDDCLVVFQSITSLLPKTAVERLLDVVVSSNVALTGIKNYCKNIKINEATVGGMNELMQKLNDIQNMDELKLKKEQVYDDITHFLPPPNNFRELTIYPVPIDLECEKPFLRPNVTKGAYQSVEHYLDVQFRLLREDFIAPLREGIKFYKERLINQQDNQHKKRINNIRVYQNVEFEKEGQFVNDKVGFVISFNKNNKMKVNWEMSKRFMYGSLLLFTENGFNTFFLGIVLERKIDLLKKGILVVELLENAKPIYNKSLTMIESEVFFEPYKCSMEVFQNISIHNFPMKKYIVSACNIIDHPYYINTLLETKYLIDDLYNFDVLDNNLWPSKDQLKLDEMQYRAFTAALTHEFTVIQGPPGTGKTYIGLKIMKTFINNLYSRSYIEIIDNDESRYEYLKKTTIKGKLAQPILVICYTNHALDQFMEGVLSFTNKVVRIGGQSKSSVLEHFSLKNVTRNFRTTTTRNKVLLSICHRLKDIMREINYLKKCSETLSFNDGLLELSLLKNGMPKRYHKFFKTSLDLLSWLFQDNNYFLVDPIIFINAIGLDLIDNVFHSEKLLEVKLDVEDDDDKIRYWEQDPDLELNHSDIIIYSLTVEDVKNARKELLLTSEKLEKKADEDENFYYEYEEAKFTCTMMDNIQDYFIEMLNLVDTNMNLPSSIQDLSMLCMKERWMLYFQWTKNVKEMFAPKIMSYEKMYTNVYKQYAELKELENIEILKQMNVVALTTTGAAKHRIMLEGLQSPIVVVEEAAEVLEAHIISSLTRHCQHLILIGDHKQLRPSNAVYKLAKNFNFDVSLFERMINNGVPCYTLGEQHRMRPEIASLISPTIYPHLNNHFSVNNREHVRGVTKDLFFLNHNVYEEEVEEITSKRNDHEASFLIMFARHLLLQGYKSDQVTILTTYSGQMFHFRSLRKKYPILEGLRITVVDNYQGEENDIILLSLVRSNESGNVGFLKSENRICVALSRAKYGFYIMGNMDNLCNSGNLWKQIKDTLINYNSYGDELVLECAIHSGITTKVSKNEDFNLVMEGGCSMHCQSLLLCGHYCASICHSYDREHKKIKCTEPCNRSCDYNHPCTKKCFMDCGKCTVLVQKELSCGHQLLLPCFIDSVTFPCEEKVNITLDKCGHTIIKKCHDENPSCTFKCVDRLDCGHACERNCHKNDDADHVEYKCQKPCESINKNCSFDHKCQKPCYKDCLSCTVKVTKILLCGHTKKNVVCGLNDNKVKCFLPCNRLLTCNHKCNSICFELCKPCKIKVKKVIPDCGHSVSLECSKTPEQKHCKDICERTLKCGHKCKNLCSIPCSTEECKEIVLKSLGKLSCGHDKVWVFCCDKYQDFSMDSQYLLDKCQEPCLQKLNCNDICLGKCGQCKQGRLHIPCKEPCNKINPCNHTCKFPCKERCPPCDQKCLYSCIHSKCTKICGDPCMTCKEKCTWECSHLFCSKLCGEMCDREPCYESCKLKLQCGHECIGFCGEPCPPLCRICQKDEVTTIIFGNEDEPDARFVYLEDCKHTVESTALEKWLKNNEENEEIILKQCPLCKTPILRTLRFMNHVKEILQDILVIKRKQYAKVRSLKNNKFEMLDSLKILNKTFEAKFIGDINKFKNVKKLWDQFCHPLLRSIDGNKKYFHISVNVIESLDFVVVLFKSISKYKNRINDLPDFKMKETVINHFVWLLTVAFSYAQQLSNQQKYDINLEMARGARLVNLYEIICNEDYKANIGLQTSSSIEVKRLISDMEALLTSCKIYSQDRDDEIQHYTNLIKEKMKELSILTNQERRMIHTAMSINFSGGFRSQNQWFKCKNNHIYCITECGGPVQKANCPECKTEIGGKNYIHAPGTTVASEMYVS